jgi:hypothetical protein
MAAPPFSTGIIGSAPKQIRAFDSNDLISSFLSGAVWGGFAIGFLGIGAWIISVARKRVNFSTSNSRINQSQSQLQQAQIAASQSEERDSHAHIAREF